MDISNSVPLFSGTGVDFEEWRTKLQDYFEAYAIEDPRRLPLARLRIANSSRLLAGMTYSTLAELLAALKSEYGSKQEDEYERLFRVEQSPNESVAQFARRVQQLHSRTALPETFLRKCFIGGLLRTIQSAVHTSCPTSFDKALEAAKYQEELLSDRSAANKVSVPALHGRDNAFKPARPREPVQPQQQDQQHHPQQQARQAPGPRAPDVNDLAKQMSRLSLQLAQASDQSASHLYDQSSSAASEQPVFPAIRALLEQTQQTLRSYDLSDNTNYELLLQCNAMLEKVDVFAGEKRPLADARPHQGPLQRQRFEGFTPEAVEEDLRRRQASGATGAAPTSTDPQTGEVPRTTPARPAQRTIRPAVTRASATPSDPIEQLASSRMVVTHKQFFSSCLPAAQQLVQHATAWMDSAQRAHSAASAPSPADPMETAHVSAHAHVSPGPVQSTNSKPASYFSAGYRPLHVSARVGNMPCDAIVDTGSSNTVVSQKFVRRMGLMDDIIRSNHTFSTASGASSKLWGKIPDLPVGIGGLVIPVEAHVTEALSYDVLIGMDWLAMAGARIDLDGNQIVLRQGLDSDITAPLLESRRTMTSCFYERGTGESLMYAGHFNLYEGAPKSFPISIHDSEEDPDPDFYIAPSIPKFQLSHQDVVSWSSAPNPYVHGEVVDVTAPDIFVDPDGGNPFIHIMHMPCGVCRRFIPCSSSAPGHQPIFCPECYGGLLEVIFLHDMHLPTHGVT